MKRLPKHPVLQIGAKRDFAHQGDFLKRHNFREFFTHPCHFMNFWVTKTHLYDKLSQMRYYETD